MKNKQNIVYVGIIGTILCVGIDVLLFPLSSDLRTFFIIGLYCTMYYRFHMIPTMTLAIAFIFLISSYIQFMITDFTLFVNPSGVPVKAERMAVWVYIFMLIGIMQQWREYLCEEREYKKKRA